jgi:PAS domain S-box-containing protein
LTRSTDKSRGSNASRSSGRRRAAPAVASASILLVDDHPPNLMALEAILEPLGERLVRASSGVEAVEIAAGEDFALVLLDLQMPELDGLETAALLKKAERSHAVPIIILTANEPSRDTVSKGYASGAVDFLYKPLDPDVLRSKVTVFVDLYKQRPHARDSDPALRRGGRSAGASPPEESSGRMSERLIAAAPPSEQAETVEALVRIHSALNEDLDVAGIAQRLVDETTSLTGANAGAFHWSLHGTIQVALSGVMRDELGALGPGSPLMTRVFGGVGTLRIDDASRELGPRAPKGVRSALAVPVLSRDGQVAGALVLLSDRARAFDDRDEELAAVAARHAAAALENARLYEDAKDARRRAELAELELRAGEARVRLALDSAGLGTFDYNPTTGALRWDTRSRALFGLPPDAPVSYSVYIAGIHPDDRARVDAANKRALDPHGDGSFDVEYRTVGIADGVERWVAANGQAFVENGRAVRFVGTFLDVTAKKIVEQERAAILVREQELRAEAETAQARAEAASRAKDEFLATVSHELRNPLNAILGWSRVLLEEGDEEVPRERIRKGLEVIARNAKAQVQLVEDILEVSRIVSGKLRLTTGPTDVRTVVEASLDTVRSAAQAKGVVLEMRIEQDIGTIVADEDRMQQILWNLLSNAVKFTPRGGSVTLDAQREADAVVLAVRDTGEGIDPAFLPFVFDRFRQADGSTTRLHGGLGLGLAIARHLVELHGGTVRADSDGASKGATFTVRLPIHAAPPSESVIPKLVAAKASVDARTDSRLADVHVLVLDDEEDMRDLISMILEHAGARVTRVPTVDAALKAIAADRPDVAVSDLAMPGEDGYAFVRRVRAGDLALRTLPLVAMTAYARAEDRHRVLAAGFQRHVAKPIEPIELVDALVEVAAGRG